VRVSSERRSRTASGAEGPIFQRGARASSILSPLNDSTSVISRTGDASRSGAIADMIRKDMNKPPIFIIGCPRSGTSLLRLILDSHSQISSGPETHFLVELAKIFGPYWERLERFGFDRDYWSTRIADFFSSFQIEYAKKRGKSRWCEKTPRYTEHLDFIDTLFPDAQFLHVIRHGLDVVASHRDRWGLFRAIRASDTWRNYVTLGRTFGGRLPAERYLELRYEDLVLHAEETGRKIFDFLNEPWELAVLEYERSDHDMSEDGTQFRRRRRREGGDDAMIFRSRIGAGAREAGPMLQALFWIKSRKLLAELGYSWRGVEST
jgi:hypothetical protein